jgi:hypothetical protein
VDDFVETRSSAGSSTPWAQLLALIETLQTGDRLMVSELARLGRSLGQMVQIVERLLQRSVRLVARLGPMELRLYGLMKLFVPLFGSTGSLREAAHIASPRQSWDLTVHEFLP